MKTPAQILNDYFFSFKDGHKEKIISAMKEYAKQWVEHCASKATTRLSVGGVLWIDETSIRNVKKEIDAQ